MVVFRTHGPRAADELVCPDKLVPQQRELAIAVGKHRGGRGPAQGEGKRASLNDGQSFAATAMQGTVQWMAPEVLRGQSYGLSADVYSFGVVLWEILVRQQPFAHLNHFQII